MAYIYDLTDTWNAGGTTFNGIKLNVTDSASAVSSKLVTLQTNGTEHFSVTKAGVGYVSGSLGVGTSSPGDKLSIAAGRIRLDQDYQIVWQNAGTNRARIAGDSGNNIIFENGSANTERMRITSAGLVGVGTTAPDTRMTVSRTSQYAINTLNPTAVANNKSGIAFYGLNSSTATQFYAGISADFTATAGGSQTGALVFETINTNSVGERMRITGPGNVGIGTTSPDNKLEVTVGDNAGINIEQSGANQTGFFNFRDSDGALAGRISYDHSNNSMRLATNETERMRIDASGNLLVGTTSNTYGSRCVFASNGGSNIMETRQTGTGNQYHAIFINANGAVGSITTDGSATQFTTSSDVRLKHDIVDAPEASSLIDAIQVRSFDWKSDGSHQRYGFVAQELVTVAPEAVSQPADPEEMMGVDYSKLVPMLVKEIQSLRARVAQLEGN